MALRDCGENARIIVGDSAADLPDVTTPGLCLGARFQAANTADFWELVADDGVPEGRSWREVETADDDATAVLGFGTTDTGPGAVSFFLDPWFGGRPAGNDEPFKRVPRAGTLRRFYLQARVGPVGGSVTFTLRRNGADTGVLLVLGAGATQAADVGSTLPVVAGDRLSLRADKATAGAGALDVAWTMELTD